MQRGGGADHLTLTVDYSAPYWDFGTKPFGALLFQDKYVDKFSNFPPDPDRKCLYNQGLTYRRSNIKSIIIPKPHNNNMYPQILC